MKWIFNKIVERPKTNPRLLVSPIKSVINTLEWHPTRKWSRRTIGKIDTVLVHQAAMVDTVEGINKFHITPTNEEHTNHLSDNGAPHIAYHFVINRSGQIYQTNRITDVTWHAKGYNTRAIGVLVNGNFDGPHWKGEQVPTPAQIRNLKRLLRILHKKYNIQIDNIKGHGEINPMKEACPGNILLDVLQTYRNTYA